jgi:hypothetical protein
MNVKTCFTVFLRLDSGAWHRMSFERRELYAA